MTQVIAAKAVLESFTQVQVELFNQAILGYIPTDREHIELSSLLEAYNLLKRLRNKSNSALTKKKCNFLANIITSYVLAFQNVRVFFEMGSSHAEHDFQLRSKLKTLSRNEIVEELEKSLESPSSESDCYSRSVISVRLGESLEHYMCLPFTALQPEFAKLLIRKATFFAPAYSHTGEVIEDERLTPTESTSLSKLEKAIFQTIGPTTEALLKIRR
jgi:hypothetical protein